MFMMTSFVVRFNFIFMMFCPYGGSLGPTLTVGPNIRLHLNHNEPLSATVVALIRFISHLNIKIGKLLSLKLQLFSLT